MSSQYPAEVVRIMANQIYQTRRTIGYHFARRHTTHNHQGVRNWIAELRLIDKASGYSECVRQSGLSFVSYRARGI